MLSKKWFLVSIFVIQQLIAAHHPAYVLVEDSATLVPKRCEMKAVDEKRQRFPLFVLVSDFYAL